MKSLKDMVSRLDYTPVKGELDIDINNLCYDSRKVAEGDIFVCVSGAAFDGHDFISDVISKGAKVIVISKDVEVQENVTVLRVNDARVALAELSAAFFDYPADDLKVIGVTGTKGKTTTTYMVKSVLENVGIKTGLIGTIEAIIGDEHIPAVNTTPESFVLQSYFRKMVDSGIKVCVMEVSSQGLMMHRVDGFTFELGIFTNISPDHIGPNEHASFEEYMECKSLLFKKCRHAIVNGDDENYKNVLKGCTCDVSTFAVKADADYKATDIKLVHKPGYLGIEYDVKGNMNEHFVIDLPGMFSVYNSLSALAICDYLKVNTDKIKEALKVAKVRGRIEKVENTGDFTVLIDYAHNAMALESLLSTLKEYDPGRLVTVFGCGGNRSKLRRFEMGEVSGKLSDVTIITSDNPRDEDPLLIMQDIETGIKKTDGKYMMIPDRREAVKYAIKTAKTGDVIIIAGKGHEDYQEIKGKKYPMDDRELVASAL
ncbi:MAG: UDP-N-acetylmuramoyl-L-alanyl-D-glutamate--2,6-diaminopimelate ligase [Lachnospiraceae bacterium]|nr:UDP-N-acetylmuramoyl-L-alanyl-D-glutamate--2,6-diaminopimelate ligase [Lachnospiraceae bacterium]MBR4794924.1 UDP-N-acetylmuramoyl-L-alanyl-D-glutamate--2,6-diaminopimelate ligase [Lachnospiraceae bacterium]